MPENSKSVEELLIDLPPVEQVLVKRLRALITECIPKATEHMYDDVDMPFYKHNKLICFILPASVSWESNRTSERSNRAKGTVLGFNQGYLMSNDEVLLAEGRTQVYQMYFKSIKDLDESQVRAMLFEAAMIDEGLGRRRSKN